VSGTVPRRSRRKGEGETAKRRGKEIEREREREKENRRSPEGRSRGARENRPGRVASDERTEDPGVPCACSRMRDAGRRHVAGSRLCSALSRQRGSLTFADRQISDGHEKRVDVHTSSKGPVFDAKRE